MKKVFDVFQNIVVVLACLILLAGAVCMVFGFRPVIVVSGSMEPEIKTGSLCFYNAKAVFEDVEKEDIIVYNRGNIQVAHRVVEIKDDGIVTKGDANDAKDKGLVSEYNYLGNVAFWIPALGKVAMFFKTTAGIVVLVSFMIFMFVMSIVLKKEKG